MDSKNNSTIHQSNSDSILLEELRKDSHFAFSAIYDKYWQGLYNAAYNLLGEQEACDDLIQEIFIWLWENRNKHITDSLKPYLHAAVRYKVANLIRHGKIKDEYLEKTLSAYNSSGNYSTNDYELSELQSIISLFTESLPTRAQTIFKMSRQELLSNKEIASSLGLSEKTVENQITISLKKLKNQFLN